MSSRIGLRLCAMAIALRPAGPDDLPFIHEMFVVAANWNPARPTHDFETIVQDARMRLYVEDWGRLGDAGVIAEEDGVPVGAAWRRLYSAVEPSYGFLSSDIPEVSIGVRAAFRGRGIGGALLTALAEDARRSRVTTLSLSVEPGNPALRLYLRQGYRIVRSSDEDHVLRLDLGVPSGDATLQ